MRPFYCLAQALLGRIRENGAFKFVYERVFQFVVVDFKSVVEVVPVKVDLVVVKEFRHDHAFAGVSNVFVFDFGDELVDGH